MELPECHFCIQINCVKILCRYVTYEFKLSRINLFQKRQISTLGIDIVKWYIILISTKEIIKYHWLLLIIIKTLEYNYREHWATFQTKHFWQAMSTISGWYWFGKITQEYNNEFLTQILSWFQKVTYLKLTTY